MVARTEVTSIHESHRFQIVTSADRGLRPLLHRDEKLRHRADERVWKPTLCPARFMKSGIPFPRVAER